VGSSPPRSANGAQETYSRYYSLTSLRRRAEAPISDDSFVDAWEGMKRVFQVLSGEIDSAASGVPGSSGGQGRMQYAPTPTTGPAGEIDPQSSGVAGSSGTNGLKAWTTDSGAGLGPHVPQPETRNSQPETRNPLGLSPLNGELFGPDACHELELSACRNRPFLTAIRGLTTFLDTGRGDIHGARPRGSRAHGAIRRAVNFKDLDVEELGSVYESLLEYHPHINLESAQPFDLVAGSERKQTGSYYTPSSLVRELIKSALEPVIEDRLREVQSSEFRVQREDVQRSTFNVQRQDAGPSTPSVGAALVRARDAAGAANPPMPGVGAPLVGAQDAAGADIAAGDEPTAAGEATYPRNPKPETRNQQRISHNAQREAAILSIRVCDTSSGSGHFLLAAARRLARELAAIRAGEDEPSPAVYRQALRDVIRQCIYAVDKNPLAVDLCKVALWIEGYNSGLPLSFLDNHVRCGDSLVGVFDLGVLEDGIPDGAYTAVTGDDKAAAAMYKKRNKEERKGQQSLWSQTVDAGDVVRRLAPHFAQLAIREEALPYETRDKAAAYDNLRGGRDFETVQRACDLWTAAFFLRSRRPAPTASSPPSPPAPSVATSRPAPPARKPKSPAGRTPSPRNTRFSTGPSNFPKSSPRGAQSSRFTVQRNGRTM
jgi:hypothetical protein